MTEAEFIKEAAEALRSATSLQNAARKVYGVCRKAAKAWGMKPEIECNLSSPLQAARGGASPFWHVSFEAGPYDWAVAVSNAFNDKVWAEPYYGFDLHFYPQEER